MARRNKQSPRTTQTERAYGALKRAILRAEIPEGVFLSEAEIIERYGIGRTPFREACNRLHLEGLLEAVPRRGYLVPELSFHAVRDLFEARLILEAAIAELAAVRASEADIEELEGIAGVPVRKPGPDPEETVERNSRFHLRLARITQNRELARILGGILDQTRRLMYLELCSSRPHASAPLELHRAVVSAIRKRDPAAARKAVLRDITEAQSATFGRAPLPLEGALARG
ncbi:MAG: GntR family transcriptional regulator [Acidobacteriia bacterium]|nr:GntR family transcriptional regulator [Terriglobia bacterium]